MFIRVLLLSSLLFTFGSYPKRAEAKFFKKIGRTITKPFRKIRDWTGKQIYKASGLDRLVKGAENVVKQAEGSGNRLIKSAGQEARKTLTQVKKDFSALLDQFDKNNNRTLEKASKLAQDMAKKLDQMLTKHLSKIEGLLGKGDKIIEKHLKTLREMQAQFNQDARERLQQVDDIIKARLVQADKIAEKRIIQADLLLQKRISQITKGAQRATRQLHDIVHLLRSTALNTVVKGGMEGAAALAHLRYNIAGLDFKTNKLPYSLGAIRIVTGKLPPAIVRVYPRSIFSKRKPFRSLMLIYQDFPRRSLSGQLRAYLQRENSKKRIPLNLTLISKVKMRVSLAAGKLLPGKYRLYVKIYQSQKKIKEEKRQPSPIEIRQEKVKNFVLLYQIRYKGKVYPSRGFKKLELKKYHPSKKIKLLPFYIDGLKDAKINLSLMHSDGRGDAKEVSGDQDVQFSKWGFKTRLYLQKQGKSCFGKVIRQKYKQAEELFWKLNRKAAKFKLKNPCEKKTYQELKKFAKTHFFASTPPKIIKYRTYLWKSRTAVFLQVTSF